jgi:hypothetical protein
MAVATAAQFQDFGRGRARQRRAALTLGAGVTPAAALAVMLSSV